MHVSRRHAQSVGPATAAGQARGVCLTKVSENNGTAGSVKVSSNAGRRDARNPANAVHKGRSRNGLGRPQIE